MLAVANSVRSLDEGDWNDLVASAETVENSLQGGPIWQDAGFDLDDLPVGSWRTPGDPEQWLGQWPQWLVARIDDDTVIGVFIESHLGGRPCYFLPVGGNERIGFGRAVSTGTIADPARPEAAAFVNECTGATYSLTGDVVSGSAVGLATFPVRVTADDRIEYAPHNQEAGRPAAA